jgi:hypothetical protein
MRIAIVGNAKVDSDQGALVDASSLVVRFNRCESLDGGFTGKRTDALALTNTGETGKRFADGDFLPELLKRTGTSTVWLIRAPGLYRERAKAYSIFDGKKRQNFTEHTALLARAVIEQEIVIFEAKLQRELDKKLAARNPETASYMPSSGMLVIEHVLHRLARPADEVVVLGFRHDGAFKHPWDAEKQLVDDYAREGKLRRAGGA